MSVEGKPEGELWDAPNQQVVRADASAPWEEGTGGSGGGAEAATSAQPGGTPTLDEMTKPELLDQARSLGVTPANNDMTKEELRAGIDAKLAEGGESG